MKHTTPILAIFVFLLLISTTFAQNGKLTIATWVVGSGGESRGSQYTIVGVAGQPDAGEMLQSSRYTIAGGFWAMVGNLIGTDNNRALYLPLIALQPTPIPTFAPIPQSAWQRLGNGGLDMVTMATQGDQIFAGDRRGFPEGGGLYKRTLAGCDPSPTWARFATIGYSVRSLVFQGTRGAVAAFTENGLFYSADSGNNWTQTGSSTGKPRAVTVSGNNTFFAGTEEDGVYNSGDQGVTWGQQKKDPLKINALRIDLLDATLLWIGTDDTGVWSLDTGNSRLLQNKEGLAGNSLRIWDFAFSTDIYIATSDGVYKGRGTNIWQPFGLQGNELRSLEIVGDQLYAGGFDPDNKGTKAGVRHRPLNGGDWQELSSPGWDTTSTVRDLLHEPTFCKGLLAATDDGVWVYR